LCGSYSVSPTVSRNTDLIVAFGHKPFPAEAFCAHSSFADLPPAQPRLIVANRIRHKSSQRLVSTAMAAICTFDPMATPEVIALSRQRVGCRWRISRLDGRATLTLPHRALSE
jgi:hypothetical protein